MSVNTKIEIRDRLSRLGVLKIDEPLSNYTSFKTGGPADFLIWPKDWGSLKEIVMLSKEESVPLTILGGCTNLLIGDKGMRGIVVMLNGVCGRSGRLEIQDEDLIYSDSMIKKDNFMRFCLAAGYEGMEFMAGLPGCIGGGIIMNAGTVDGSFADILESVLLMDTEGRIIKQNLSRASAGYRAMSLAPGAIILAAFFRLAKSNELQEIKLKINAILEERKQKHPLNFPSAGSVFKNPAGHSSWKLINDSGLRGKCIGGACVSELHTNFIVNAGNSSSLDILNLIDYVKEKVYSKFNILMEPEIRIIGEF